MLITFFLFNLCLSIEYESILIISSRSTKPEYLLKFESFPNKFQAESIEPPDFESIILIIDITQDFQYFQMIESLCEHFQSFYLTLTGSSLPIYSKFRLHALPNPNVEGKKLANLIKFMNWTSFSLISCSSSENIRISNSVIDNTSVPGLLIVLDETIDNEALDTFIKRVFKASGQNNFLIVCSDVTKLQKGLLARKANKHNSRFLFSSYAVSQVIIENSLVLALHGSNSSISYIDSVFLYLKYLIEKYQSTSQKKFLGLCPQNDCSNYFEIIKIKNLTQKVIGRYQDTIIIDDLNEVTLNNFSLEKPLEILIFIANGTSELGQKNRYFQSAFYYKGSLYAINRANKENSLQGFFYKTLSTDCGNLIFNEKWYISCFSELVSKNPVAFLTSLYISSAYGNAITLKTLGIKLPQISALALNNALDDPRNFSEYLSLSGTFGKIMQSGLMIVLKNFNWKSFIVFTTLDYSSAYDEILTAQKLGLINILNPVHLRFFEGNYSRLDYEKYKEYFLFALESKCRLFVILSNNPTAILEALYEAGFRKGEFLSIWTSYTISQDLNDLKINHSNKIAELIQGSLVITSKEWEGELGRQLKREFESQYKTANSMCFTYDSFLVIHQSIKHLIGIGEDYEDPELMSKAMRNIRFTGCSGSIYFSSAHNHWSAMKIMLQQFVENEKTGSIELIDFISADISSQTLVTVLNDPYWPNSDQNPSNFIEFGECGFNPRLSKKSKNGFFILIFIFGAIFFNTVIFSVFGWKRFKNCFNEFIPGREISTSDMLILISLFLELVQFISLEPKNGIFSKTLKNLNIFLAFLFFDYFELKFVNFWRLYLIFIVFVLLIVVLVILSLWNSRRTKRFFSKNHQILCLIKIFLSFSLSSCFFPIVFNILKIIQCTESLEASFYSIYFKYDCKEFCYQGKHLKYSIIGLVGLACYTGITSYSRVFWESIHVETNLRTNPSYLAFLTVFQVLVVAIRMISQEYSQVFSGFIVSGLLLMFAVFTCLNCCFNLKRIWILQVSILFVCFWGLLFSTLFVMQELYIYVFLCYSGIGIISIATFLTARRYPQGFKEQKVISVEQLIKFQFLKGFEDLMQETIFKKIKNGNQNQAFKE